MTQIQIRANFAKLMGTVGNTATGLTGIQLIS